MLLGLASAELALRLFYRGMPASLWSERGNLVPAADALAVYGYRPGARYGLNAINRWGFRDVDWTTEKSPGTYRIAAIGDSFTFGHAVSLEATWVKQLAHLLKEVNGRPVEILNFGVQGYNTRNELGVLRSRVLEFEPDMVLVGHVEGDAWPDFMRVSRGQLLFHFEADPDRRIPIPVPVKGALYRHSLLYRLLAGRYLSRFEHQIGAEQAAARRNRSAAAADDPRRDLSAQQMVDKQSLRQIAALVEQAGARLVILDFPLTPTQATPTKTREQRQISKQLARLGQSLEVPVIDLFPVVRETRLAELRVAADDYHPAADLHAEYARYLEPQIRRLIESDLE